MKKAAHSSEKALSKFMHLCSRKEYCVSEITQKLNNWLLDEDEKEHIIAELKKENFINEERYARAFVCDKLYFNKWGKQKIRYALLQKKISKETIETALNQISEDYYYQMISEEMTKKQSSLGSLPSGDMKAKLLRFAANRGYEQELVWKIIDDLFKFK